MSGVATARRGPIAALNPVAKLGAALLIALPLVLTIDPVSAAVALLLELPLLAAAGLHWREFWIRTLPIWIAAPLAGLTIALYGATSGEIYVEWFVVRISEGSLTLALATFFRVLAIGLPAVVLFVTVDPTDLADGLAQLLKLPARFVLGALAGMRLLGLLTDDWRALALARRARGVADTGRVRRVLGMAFALFVLSIRRGSTLATAMEARGFGGTGARTWARESRFGWREWVLLVVGAAISATAITVAVLTGSWNFILGGTRVARIRSRSRAPGSRRAARDRVRCRTPQERALPPGAVVPLGAHRRHGEIGPAIAHPERTEVDVRGPLPVVADQRVRAARVAVAHDQHVDGRCLPKFVGHTDAAALGIREPRGHTPLERALGDGEPLVQGAERLADRTNGGRRAGHPARHDGAVARERPGREPLVRVIAAQLQNVRHGCVACRPRQALRLGRERGLAIARAELDVPLVVGAEREPADLVDPHRLEAGSARDLAHPIGHRDRLGGIHMDPLSRRSVGPSPVHNAGADVGSPRNPASYRRSGRESPALCTDRRDYAGA